ncbi:hypothetical protein HPE56_18865 [Maribacter sp. ANRC-HE7]|uniref:PH domain-containing protein n=1 Tax=Maribacter aquimaris TaxID=2737171 RepID=A0ABR7V4Z0_9FLAO|nr:hypothetical protein [Maribacter aquimaris]MBD0779864.1 hypothetical protein [Maribacter aquimaris]
MGLIEKISNEEPGVHSVLVKDSWQVVKVNYSIDHEVDNLGSLYMNTNSGLAVALLKGRAILIKESGDDHLPFIQTIPMVRGTSYFIPENLGFHIVMKKGSELFRVESPQGSAMEVLKRPLDKKELDIIKRNVIKEFKS